MRRPLLSRWHWRPSRRALVGGAAILLFAALTMTAAAAGERQDPSATVTATPTAGRQGSLARQLRLGGATVAWSATSPATHPGDQYRLTLVNGATPQRVWVRTVIMDHSNHVNTVVLEQALELAAGERRELAASNDYGVANHFNTILAAQHGDLGFEVVVTDAQGAEAARFNQRAFMQRELPHAGRAHDARTGSHAGHTARP